MTVATFSYDLHLSGLEVALDEHRKQCGHDPTTLIIPASAEMIHKAYLLISGEFPGVPRMLIVPVPGLASDAWMVASPDCLVMNNVP